MWNQVDDEGFHIRTLASILDYQKDSRAVSKEDGYVRTRSGQRRFRKTTVGWKLYVLWKDGTKSWVPLKDLKETHPIELAEFAKANGLVSEPAFQW